MVKLQSYHNKSPRALMTNTGFDKMPSDVHSLLFSFTAKFSNYLLKIYRMPASTLGSGKKNRNDDPGPVSRSSSAGGEYGGVSMGAETPRA